MISSSPGSIEKLVDELIQRSRQRNNWSPGAEWLQFMMEFEKHSSSPDAHGQLIDALDARGWSFFDLITSPLPEFAFVPLAVMRQHAVGHGGFHTGAMGRGTVRLRWVYDCGASRSQGLQRLSEEIERLAGDSEKEKRRVDLLFISHFDRDHISGIKELMRLVAVGTVVIPYLDDLQRAIALVDDVSTHDGAELDQTLTEVLFDPVRWLTDLGAQHVVQIQPGGPGFDGSRLLRYGPGDGPELPDDIREVQPVLVRQHDEVEPKKDQSIVASGSGWMVTHFGRQFGDWCFLPYVTPAGHNPRGAFAAAFRQLLELKEEEPLVDAFRRRMGEDGFVSKIKTAYKEQELGDANAVSMSLYVGPFRAGVYFERVSLSAEQKIPEAGPGWLLTGDAKLAQVGRRNLWRDFYKPLRDHIGALMLPHHGSHLNFHVDILDVVKEGGLLFACKRAKTFGDPLHEDVWTVLKDRQVTIVSDEYDTSLIQVSGTKVLNFAEHVLSSLLKEWR